MKKFDYDIDDEEYLWELEDAISEDDNPSGNNHHKPGNGSRPKKVYGQRNTSPDYSPVAGYMLSFCAGIILTAFLFGGFIIINRLRNPAPEDVPWNHTTADSGQTAISDSITSEDKTETHENQELSEEKEDAGQSNPDGTVSNSDKDGEDKENRIVSPDELENPPRLDKEGKIIKDTIPASAIQVVAFGDSLWDMVRGEDSISRTLSTGLEGAYVYNCAFGATTATLATDSGDDYLDRISLTSIVDYVVGSVGMPVTADSGDGYNALARADFSRTEYFILSFGLVDFFNNKYINNDYFAYDKYSFTGALRYSAEKIHEKYPDAKIIIAAPNYVYGNPSNDFGNIDSYIDACEAIASECGAMFFNPNEALGMNTENCKQFLADGAYLNSISRTLYADALAAMILEDRS